LIAQVSQFEQMPRNLLIARWYRAIPLRLTHLIELRLTRVSTVILVADDLSGELAELEGYGNRSAPDNAWICSSMGLCSE
jgi:hypothetical protein